MIVTYELMTYVYKKNTYLIYRKHIELMKTYYGINV